MSCTTSAKTFGLRSRLSVKPRLRPRHSYPKSHRRASQGLLSRF
jgi:hypothetical protein